MTNHRYNNEEEKKKSFGASKLKANTKHKRKKKLIINMQICASQPYSKTMFHAKKKKKITALFCTQVILCMTNKLRECEGETECANGRMLWKTPSRFENDKCNNNINVNETRRGKVKRRIKW